MEGICHRAASIGARPTRHRDDETPMLFRADVEMIYHTLRQMAVVVMIARNRLALLISLESAERAI